MGKRKEHIPLPSSAPKRQIIEHIDSSDWFHSDTALWSLEAIACDVCQVVLVTQQNPNDGFRRDHKLIGKTQKETSREDEVE